MRLHASYACMEIMCISTRSLVKTEMGVINPSHLYVLVTYFSSFAYNVCNYGKAMDLHEVHEISPIHIIRLQPVSYYG